MRYLFRRGNGARRRVMHLTGYDQTTGKPSMVALCGSRYPFDATCNVPWGQPTCENCRRQAAKMTGASDDEW